MGHSMWLNRSGFSAMGVTDYIEMFQRHAEFLLGYLTCQQYPWLVDSFSIVYSHLSNQKKFFTPSTTSAMAIWNHSPKSTQCKKILCTDARVTSFVTKSILSLISMLDVCINSTGSSSFVVEKPNGVQQAKSQQGFLYMSSSI